MSKHKHPDKIAGMSGQEFGEKMANLRFDTMADTLGFMADALLEMAAKDREAGRKNLAFEVQLAALKLKESVAHLDRSWELSKKKTDTDTSFDLIQEK